MVRWMCSVDLYSLLGKQSGCGEVLQIDGVWASGV